MKFLIIAALLLVGSGCDGDDRDNVKGAVDTAVPKGIATPYGPFVSNYQHDGHTFIVFFKAARGSADGGVAVLHHPDCECFKKAQGR